MIFAGSGKGGVHCFYLSTRATNICLPILINVGDYLSIKNLSIKYEITESGHKHDYK